MCYFIPRCFIPIHNFKAIHSIDNEWDVCKSQSHVSDCLLMAFMFNVRSVPECSMFNVHAIFIWQRMTLILCQIDFQSLLFPSLAFHISKLASLPKWTTRFHHQHSDFRCIVMVDHTRLESNYDCAAFSQIVDVAYRKKVRWKSTDRQILTGVSPIYSVRHICVLCTAIALIAKLSSTTTAANAITQHRKKAFNRQPFACNSMVKKSTRDLDGNVKYVHGKPVKRLNGSRSGIFHIFKHTTQTLSW